MKKLLLIYILQYYMFAQDASDFIVVSNDENSFISPYEYGKLLYNNPRGISCAKCHGIDAQGKLIAKFVHTRKKVNYDCKVQTKNITNISKKNFLNKLNYFGKKDKKNFNKEQVCEKLIYGNTMPKYFLTSKEMESIYYYITHIGESE